MRNDEMVWTILTYAGIDIHRQEHASLIEIYQNQITDDSMECMCHNTHSLVVQISHLIDQNTDQNYHNIYSFSFEFFWT